MNNVKTNTEQSEKKKVYGDIVCLFCQHIYEENVEREYGLMHARELESEYGKCIECGQCPPIFGVHIWPEGYKSQEKTEEK